MKGHAEFAFGPIQYPQDFFVESAFYLLVVDRFLAGNFVPEGIVNT